MNRVAYKYMLLLTTFSFVISACLGFCSNIGGDRCIRGTADGAVTYYFEGAIVIGQWMRDMCASEDELAAIVAHEKAHLVLKHGEKTWYEKLSGWIVSWFVDESKPRFRGPPDPKSVARESEADEKGLMLMAEAGYDPQAAVDFWTRYYERTGWWEGDGTHPKPRERLAHLSALMPKAKELYRSAPGKKAAILVSTTQKEGTP